MAQTRMTTEEFKRLTHQTRERSDAAPPKRRKNKDHYRAKYAATPTRPALTAEEKARQRALFERHDKVEVQIRLPLPPSANMYWESWVRPGTTRAMVHVGNEGQAFSEAVVSAWKSHYQGWPPEPTTARLRLLVSVSYPTKAAIDLDNRVKPLQDALKKAGAYADDSQIDDLRVIRGPVSPSGGYVEVILETINEETGT